MLPRTSRSREDFFKRDLMMTDLEDRGKEPNNGELLTTVAM